MVETNGSPQQPRYRIGAVAHATGLTTHTIRVWERRYRAVEPQRTPGGDRRYSDADIARLRLLRQLQRAGHGIGTIARLPAQELESILLTHHSGTRTWADDGQSIHALRDAFLDAVARLDQSAADRVLATATATLSAQHLVYDFVAPVLTEIGARWEAGTLSIAHEHAASTVLREHISVLLRVHAKTGSPRRVVVTTPAGERHEFGALMVGLLSAVEGWAVQYLGPDLPAVEIARAVRASQAEVVLLSWVCAEPEQVLKELAAVREAVPEGVRICVGGAAVTARTELPPGIIRSPELSDLERELRR